MKETFTAVFEGMNARLEKADVPNYHVKQSGTTLTIVTHHPAENKVNEFDKTNCNFDAKMTVAWFKIFFS